MITCTSCGADVTGKKFCPHCGTPVQPTAVPAANTQSTVMCPRCGGEVKSGAAFCMHCGSALHAQPLAVTAAPATRICPACHMEVPVESAFCVHCGQNMNASAPSPQVTVAPAFCTTCGKQNAPEVTFCGGCGTPIAAPAIPSGANYVPPGQYPQQQYGQPQYSQQLQYPQQQYSQPQYQQQPQYGQPQYNQYNQSGYQQQPMTLRCPVCMAMSPMGTPNCPSCHTSLAGVVPTPINMPAQGQQGGLGGFLQGNGGNMAMGALGGAAAVIGGEMLLHGIENRVDGDMEYGHRHHHRDEGLLGGLGDIANDVGLF